MAETTLLNDQELQAIEGLIEPFTPEIIRQIDGRRVFSYGLGSYGYDIRLSPDDCYVYNQDPSGSIDPKAFDSEAVLTKLELHTDDNGSQYFMLPPHSYCLGVSEELITMPKDITAIGLGKSSYARVGINTFITPIESGWSGHLTIGIGNLTSAFSRLYANEGIAQLLFFRGNPCGISYDDRSGKYQGQGKAVTFVKV